MAANETHTPLSLLPDPSTVIGPIFVGTVINWLLMGTLTVQAYFYYVNFPKDRLPIKLLVFIVMSLDIIQTVFGTHQFWYYAVKSWNNGPALVGPSPWSAATIPIMAGLVSALVQIFYAWRIWILKGTILYRVFSALIVLIALAQSVSAITASVLFEFNATQADLIRLHPAFSFWLAGSFVADILISCCMITILSSARSTTSWKQSEALMDKLIVNTVQTGVITVICAAVDLALFVKFNATNYHLAPAYVLGKLYSNSFLANLNARKSHTRAPKTATESIGMKVQVSRHTERTNDTVVSEWTSAAKHADGVILDHDSESDHGHTNILGMP